MVAALWSNFWAETWKRFGEGVTWRFENSDFSTKGRGNAESPWKTGCRHQKDLRQWWQQNKQGGTCWRWMLQLAVHSGKFHFSSVFSRQRGQHNHCSTDCHLCAFTVFIICAQCCICIPGGVGIYFSPSFRHFAARWKMFLVWVSFTLLMSPYSKFKLCLGRPAMTWTLSPFCATAYSILTTLIAFLFQEHNYLLLPIFSAERPFQAFFSLLQCLPLLRLEGEPVCALGIAGYYNSLWCWVVIYQG